MQQGPIEDQDLFEKSGILLLPVEILLMIFNKTGFPAPTFSTLNLVCSHFNKALKNNQIWEQALYLHFPMLLEIVTDQSMPNFKIKFQECLADYQEKYTNTLPAIALLGKIKQSILLAALRGDLGYINSEKLLRKHTKKFLYILAAAHGSDEAWQSLEYIEKTSVLAHAVRIGYLSRFKTLIENLKNDSKPCKEHDYFVFLQTAIENSQPEIVSYLLENYSYSIEQINEAKTKVIKDDKILEKLESKFSELNIAYPDFRPITRIPGITYPERSRKRRNSW